MNQTMLGQQITQLLQMVAFGWVLMLTADEKKALAACGRWSYRKKTVGDFLFCLLWGLLFWLFLVNINGGLLRNYIFMGLFVGVGFYYFVCSRWCYRLCLLLARGILFCSGWLYRVLIFPWRILYRFCVYPCCRFWKKFYQDRQDFIADEENIIENENKFSS